MLRHDRAEKSGAAGGCSEVAPGAATAAASAAASAAWRGIMRVRRMVPPIEARPRRMIYNIFLSAPMLTPPARTALVSLAEIEAAASRIAPHARRTPMLDGWTVPGAV